MSPRKHKYLMLGILIAAFYWLVDSAIDYLVYGDAAIKLWPSNGNELWMRCLIVALLVAFGGYVEASVSRRVASDREKQLLKMDLEDVTRILLGGGVLICTSCNRVCTRDEQKDLQSSWEGLDAYVSRLVHLRQGKGTCPACGLTPAVEET